MKRSVLLSTFLFAAVLSPMLLQTNYCDLEKYQKLATLELYVPDINGQNVISDFNPDGILYKVELPVNPPDTAVLLVQAQDATATIEVTYDSLPISLGPNGVAPLTLAPDHSEIKVAVRGDNKAWTYTVSIDRVDYCPCDDGNACTYDICMPATRCVCTVQCQMEPCVRGLGADATGESATSFPSVSRLVRRKSCSTGQPSAARTSIFPIVPPSWCERKTESSSSSQTMRQPTT